MVYDHNTWGDVGTVKSFKVSFLINQLSRLSDLGFNKTCDVTRVVNFRVSLRRDVCSRRGDTRESAGGKSPWTGEESYLTSFIGWAWDGFERTVSSRDSRLKRQRAIGVT